MKKIYLILIFLFCFFASFGQSIINRATASNTVSDARLQAKLNAYIPRYIDTVQANISSNLGIDSCGAVIYTYDVNWFWIRQCTPKRWTLIPTPNGSLSSRVEIIDSNHIAICNINGCDTIQVNGIVGPITNITIINNTTLQVCGSDILGSEQIINGGFEGDASNWTLGTLWAYGDSNIVHSNGSTASSSQSGSLTAGGLYTVLAEIGGTVGTVALALDGGTSTTYNAGAGSVTFTGTWTSSAGIKINLTPSTDFDGTVTGVSVKPVLPNCDTLQIIPTNFPLVDTIKVIAPLHSLDSTTIYIDKATADDSGYVTSEDWRYFNNKTDSIYTRSGPSSDSIFYIHAGAEVLVYVVYTKDGIIDGGQVVYSGTPYVYNVQQAIYRLNGIVYTSPPTQITIDSADATDPRIDVFLVDSSGNAGYLAGTAAATPVQPQVDQNYQVFLTFLTVPAATTPAMDTVIIFNENAASPTEWTPPTQTGTTINPANTLNPWIGTISMNVTNINNGDVIVFPKGSTIDLIPTYQSLVFFIRLKQTIPNAANLRVRWYNSTVAVGNLVTIPLIKNNISTYQAFSIPITNFSLTSVTVDRLQFSYASNDATVNQGFFLDYIYLQNGVTPTQPAVVTPQTLQQTFNTEVGGSVLTKVDSILLTSGDFWLSIFGDAGNSAPLLNVTGGTQAIQGTGSSVGVIGSAPSVPLWSINSTASTSTVAQGLTLNRTPTGNIGAANLGTSIQWNLPDAAASTEVAGILQTIWTVATNGSETSQTDLRLRNAGSAAATVMSVHGSGVLGIGISSSYTATRLNVVDNSVGAASIVDVTSTSTAAASNAQKGINVALSGTNATSAQTTYGIYSSNAHAGTTSTNVGIYGTATSGTTSNTGVLGSADFAGVNGVTTSGYGVIGTATTGVGVYGTSASGTYAVGGSHSGTGVGVYGVSLGASAGAGGQFVSVPSSTNTTINVLKVDRLSSGTAANGIAAAIAYTVQSSTGAQNVSNRLISKWTDATDATRTSEFSITGVNSAATATLLVLSGAGLLTLSQGVPEYADNAAAILAGLAVGTLYRTGDALKVVH